jgi:hypothetical protein
MVTTAEALEALEAATGIARVTLERAAIILRTADTTLWPTGGRGGGRVAARPNGAHLINLVLAILAADPLNEAPDLVRRYRKLEPIPLKPINASLGFSQLPWFPQVFEQPAADILDPLCPGPTLGDILDGLVRYLMSTHDFI